MNPPATTFGSPSGGAEYHHQTMPQRMCEKLWTLPNSIDPVDYGMHRLVGSINREGSGWYVLRP